MKRLFTLSLALIAIVCFGACRKEQQKMASGVTEITPGMTLPESPDHLVVVDFNATWCGPCRMFAPIFHEVAKDYDGRAEFFSVDVDKNPELAEKYQVQSIPTVIYILPDGLTSRSVGYLDKTELTEIINSLLK